MLLLDPHFWCHELSELIHRSGWAKAVGQEIVGPSDYDPNPIDLTPFVSGFEKLIKELRVGKRLEVRDPLNLSEICAATITKVLNGGHFMVQMDCYKDEDGNRGTWYCFHISSPYIFNCGFCKRNNIELIPPLPFTKASEFEWELYLLQEQAEPVKLPEVKFANKIMSLDYEI